MPFGILSSIVNAMSADEQTRRQYYNNKNLMQMQQKFNAEQALLDRQFQAAMYEKDKLWNDYREQKHRMEQAGLNPALMFSDGQLAPSTSVPSGTSASSGLAQVGIGQGLNINGYSFKDVADALKSLGEAKKLGVDVDYLSKTLQDRVLEQRARTEIAGIQSMFEGKLKEKEMEKIESDVFKNYSDSFNALASGELHEAETLLVQAQEQTEKERKRLTGYQADYAKEVANVADRLLNSQIRSNNASAFKDEQTGKYIPQQVAIERHKANTMRITALADKDLKESLTKINNLDFTIRDYNKIKEMAYNARAWGERSAREGLITEEQSKQIEALEQGISQAADRHDWYMVEVLGGSLKDMCIGFGAANYGKKR